MSAYSDAVLALSPTSYWPFSGGSPLADSGSGGVTLTATGSPTRVPSLIPCESAAADSAYQFDGSSQYLQGGDVYDFAGDIDWSIALWIKVEDAAFGSGFQRILSKRTNGGNFEGYLIYGSSTSNITTDYDPGAASDEGFTAAAGVDIDEVHFLAWTWDDSAATWRLYVDGTEIDAKSSWTNAPGFPNSTGAFQISGERGANSLFGGTIDDVAVWSGTALSAQNISDLWDAANAITDGPPLRLVQSNLRW